MKDRMKNLTILEKLILHNVWGVEYDCNSAYLEEFPPLDFVYHYTGRDKAMSILNTLVESSNKNCEDINMCGFAFTDYRFLNDSLEYKLGLSFAIDWLRHTDTFPEKLRKEVMSLLKGKEGNAEFAPYVLSFCQKEDSTVHWQVYTDRNIGGYALGLDFWKLKDAVAKFNDLETGEGEKRIFFDAPPMMFLPCIYCTSKKDWKHDDKLRNALENVLSKIFAGVSRFQYNDVTHTDSNFSDYARWCAARIFQFASLVKNEEFRFEDEWRLVLRPNLIKCKEERVMFGKSMITPIRLKLGNCLRRIRVSPHGDKRRLKYLAEFQKKRLKQASNFTGSIVIRKSDSSYNGK